MGDGAAPHRGWQFCQSRHLENVEPSALQQHRVMKTSCVPKSKQQEYPDCLQSLRKRTATSPPPPVPVLTRKDALALQDELLWAYSAPRFQKKLAELARKHEVTKGKTFEYRVAFRKLVRVEQQHVLERYGFEASEQGAEAMVLALQQLETDLDIAVNGAAIEEALFGFSGDQPSESLDSIGRRPKSAETVKHLLRRLVAAYGRPCFQAQIQILKASVDKTEIYPRLAKEGYYHLPGRAEIAFKVQKQILPRCGFEASSDGVCDMITHCAGFLADPEVASLFDSINAKLGMSPDACLRFRRVVGNQDIEQTVA